MSKITRTCQFCGTQFEAKSTKAKFCSAKHRMDFHNRARDRGALLYHMFMSLRYDRALAEKIGVDWKFLCRMGEMWNAEDKELGVRSFRHASGVKEEIGAMVNARVGRL